MQDLDQLFGRLARSRFRSRFHLNAQDQRYLVMQGLPAVLQHARDFVARRLAPARPRKDGQQTPWQGHPVFVAQHGTATCCRGCLEKWHHIRRGQALTPEQQEYVVSVIEAWLRRELASHGPQ